MPMQHYEVWHLKEEAGGLFRERTAEQIKRDFRGGMYDLVAYVDAQDLNEVYRLTNSIEDFWGFNQGVVTVGVKRLSNGGFSMRSTSVGDLFVNTHPLDRNRVYQVESFGFHSFPI